MASGGGLMGPSVVKTYVQSLYSFRYPSLVPF